MERESHSMRRKIGKYYHRDTWDLPQLLEATWILMDPGLFSHDQDGMGKNVGYSDGCESITILWLDNKDT